MEQVEFEDNLISIRNNMKNKFSYVMEFLLVQISLTILYQKSKETSAFLMYISDQNVARIKKKKGKRRAGDFS